MSEWQPIETAPKDGKEILISYNYDGNIFFYVVSWVDDPEGFHWEITASERLSETYITHWMTIPHVPNKKHKCFGKNGYYWMDGKLWDSYNTERLKMCQCPFCGEKS